jgi:hypothetical protein
MTAKYNPDTSHWDQGDEEDQTPPPVELDTHTISIKDRVSARVRRSDHTRYWDWRIAIEDDHVIGWAVWEENETHVDSVPSPAPEDVPQLVKGIVCDEMGWESFDAHLDVPDFYQETGGDST